MAKNTANYGNDSIRQLKDEERVRLRPAVIFGSDGLDGCAHAAFEILSNAVDEARQGYGKLITLTAFRDGSIQVEDNGRGIPVGIQPKMGIPAVTVVFTVPARLEPLREAL